MSFLSDAEAASLRIEHMILHVVGGDGPFRPQPVLENVEGAGFFLARIMDSASDAVHQFSEPSLTKECIARIASGLESFETGAQNLSHRFSTLHVGASTDGAFFVFQLGTSEPSVKLYSLIKYDYREAVELTRRGGRNRLRQIVQAFVREKRAMQKSALIRVRGGLVEAAVSATDRMGSSPDLTEYFERFLEVSRHRDDVELSKRLNETLRHALEECKEILPDRDVVGALRRAKECLRGREAVSDDAVHEAILVASNPPSELERAQLERATRKFLRQNRLAGVTFRPDPAILRTSARRKVRTVEGVVLMYPGDQEDRAVTRQVGHNGAITITVRTNHPLEEDGTVTDQARRPA